MPSRTSSWQRIAALAPLLLLVVSMPSWVLMRCQLDGQLRSSCCCPGKDARQPGSAPSVLAQDCCDRELLTRDHPVVASIEATGRELGVVPWAIVVVLPELLAEPQQPRGVLLHGPPREGPPLVVLKQSFLI